MRVLKTQTFTNPLATLFNQRMEYTVNKWRLGVKEENQQGKENPHLVVSQSTSDISPSKDLLVLECKKHKLLNERKQTLRSKKNKSNKNAPTFSTSFHLSEIHPLDTDSSANCNDRRDYKHHKLDDVTKTHLSVHQTVKPRYVHVVDYHTYRLSNHPLRNDDSACHYIPKIVQDRCFQMMTHNFDLTDTLLVVRFLTSFKLARDASHVHKGATMRVMTHFVADHVASSLNEHTVQSENTKGFTITTNSNRATLQATILRVCKETMKYFLKRYDHDKAISEANETIFWLTKLANMAPLQCDKALCFKATFYGNDHGKDTCNGTFTKYADDSKRYSLRGYRAPHLHINLSSLAFQAQSILEIQSGLTWRK